MLTVSLPIISNGMYLLFSIVGFLVYAFLYLTYQGLLSGKRDTLHNRPPVTGFDSMRGGTSGSLPPDVSPVESPKEIEEEGFYFDHQATFQNSTGGWDKESPEMQEGLTEQESADLNLPNEDSEEEDECGDWPTPGEYAPSDARDWANWAFVGELTPDEQKLIAKVRQNLDKDAEAYPHMDEEFQEIQQRIARIIDQTGQSQDDVVTTNLTSREKVIFNAILLGQQNATT